MGVRIEWRLGGKEGRTLILSDGTSSGYRTDAKVEKQVRQDATILAGMKRESIDVQASDGSWLATVRADGKSDA
jgi:hypothetical protein